MISAVATQTIVRGHLPLVQRLRAAIGHSGRGDLRHIGGAGAALAPRAVTSCDPASRLRAVPYRPRMSKIPMTATRRRPRTGATAHAHSPPARVAPVRGRNPGKVKNHRNKIKGKVKGQKHRGTHRAYDRERCRHKHTRHPPGAGSGGNSLAPRYRLNRAVVTVSVSPAADRAPLPPDRARTPFYFLGLT